MNRLIPSILCLTLSIAIFEAVPAQAADEFTSDALRAGSWSIDFAIEDNFQIGAFEGAAISATHHTSPGSAWRYGLSFSGSVADEEFGRVTRVDSTILAGPTQQRDLNQYSIGLNALRILYPEVSGRVRPYVGFGPGIFYARRDDTIEGETERFDMELTSWSAAAEFVAGVEVFAARRVSLIAQYGAEVSYQHRKTRTSQVRTFPTPPPPQGVDDVRSQDIWHVGTGGVSLGVSAYF